MDSEGPSGDLAVTGRSLRCVAGRNGQTSMSSSDVRGMPVEPGPPDLAPFQGALRLSRHPPGGATGGTGGAVAVGSGAGPAVSIISAPSNALEDGGGRGGSGTGPDRTGREPIGRSLTKAPTATVYGFYPSPINTSPRLGTAYVGSSGSAVSPLTVT
ncbi:hypothetical protein MRX96_040170 [Rhipicephalus microplus]